FWVDSPDDDARDSLHLRHCGPTVRKSLTAKPEAGVAQQPVGERPGPLSPAVRARRAKYLGRCTTRVQRPYHANRGRQLKPALISVVENRSDGERSSSGIQETMAEQSIARRIATPAAK